MLNPVAVQRELWNGIVDAIFSTVTANGILTMIIATIETLQYLPITIAKKVMKYVRLLEELNIYQSIQIGTNRLRNQLKDFRR